MAIDIAVRDDYRTKIWCVVVENTFTCIPDMAKVILGWRVLKYFPLFFYKNKVKLHNYIIDDDNTVFNPMFAVVHVLSESKVPSYTDTVCFWLR